jgi:hypothetical protein
VCYICWPQSKKRLRDGYTDLNRRETNGRKLAELHQMGYIVDYARDFEQYTVRDPRSRIMMIITSSTGLETVQSRGLSSKFLTGGRSSPSVPWRIGPARSIDSVAKSDKAVGGHRVNACLSRKKGTEAVSVTVHATETALVEPSREDAC